MGPFSTAMLFAVLTVLRGLLFVTAALLAVLAVVQVVRGDAGAQPGPVLFAGLAFAGGGWISGRLARILIPPA